MPFAQDFEDVYTTIKTCVESTTSAASGRCFRLDESQPAGRITERLLREISSASFCVADLTGNKPNVMWELGYAMALGRPTVIVTQRLADLPFDIRDMQSLEYDRTRLSSTLAAPLRKIVIDTISAHRTEPDKKDNDQLLIGQLLGEVAELKGMVAQVVSAWNPSSRTQEHAVQEQVRTDHLEGAWFERESRSHIYAKIVNNQLIAPYCFGDDDELTGVFFEWRRAGEYWVHRFAWVDGTASGFAFVKEESIDLLSGAWWDDLEQPLSRDLPPEKHGVSANWERRPFREFPPWATRFIVEVEKRGLPDRLKRR